MKAPGRNKPAKSPLDEAIEALALACESGGDLDREIYVSAHKRLELMKAEIIAHDQKLNQDEIVPTCDDYNRIFAMMIPSSASSSPATELGKIWWSADNMEQAVSMQAEYLKKGAKAIELHPEDDRPVVAVIITLERSRAKEILGHDVAAEEWLDLSEPASNSLDR